MRPETSNIFRSLILSFLFSTQLLQSGSIFDDFRKDLPAAWRSWSQRYAGTEEDSSERPLSMEGSLPIILVHGYLNTNSGWTAFRRAFQKAHLGPVYVPRLKASAQDVRYSAQQIARVIEVVREETGFDQVILVGHSLGGIICAYCVQHLAPEGSVKAVISIAAPLRGTKTAAIGLGKAAHQMRCNCRFLKYLTAQMRYHPKSTYYCLGSSSDQMIRPYQNAFYKDPDDLIHFRLYNDIGHQTFLYDEDVINDVISMIHTLDNPGSRNHP
ncbi:MAG: hypothetical protein K940chlam3_01212 [Chlamydiae bacterium]|nr:hypothetical protein [Chlamydiota bacterium]